MIFLLTLIATLWQLKTNTRREAIWRESTDSLKIAKISQYNFFATKCTKIIHKIEGGT